MDYSSLQLFADDQLAHAEDPTLENHGRTMDKHERIREAMLDFASIAAGFSGDRNLIAADAASRERERSSIEEAERRRIMEHAATMMRKRQEEERLGRAMGQGVDDARQMWGGLLPSEPQYPGGGSIPPTDPALAGPPTPGGQMPDFAGLSSALAQRYVKPGPEADAALRTALGGARYDPAARAKMEASAKLAADNAKSERDFNEQIKIIDYRENAQTRGHKQRKASDDAADSGKPDKEGKIPPSNPIIRAAVADIDRMTRPLKQTWNVYAQQSGGFDTPEQMIAAEREFIEKQTGGKVGKRWESAADQLIATARQRKAPLTPTDIGQVIENLPSATAQKKFLKEAARLADERKDQATLDYIRVLAPPREGQP